MRNAYRHPILIPGGPDRTSRPIAAPAPGTRAVVAEPGRLKLWPLDSGRYGLDATFDGHWGCEDAEQHARRLSRWGMTSAIRPEADGCWTVRLGPLNSLDVARALAYLLR